MHSTRDAARCTQPRQGTTLAELLVVVALIAIVSAFTLPPIKRGFDRLQTRGAAHEVMSAFFVARAGAIAGGRRTAVVIDASRARVAVVSAGESLIVREIGIGHGVTLTASRDSMTFLPDGLGLGAANLSVILRRGTAVDTVVVSREGRVKLGSRAR